MTAHSVELPSRPASKRHLLPVRPGHPDNRGRQRMLACFVAAATGVALTTLIFQPGAMPDDGIIQLREARSLIFYDWHPPLMSAVWAVLDRLIRGPLLMLLLHNVLFWSGLGLVFFLVGLSPTVSALLMLAVGLFPPIASGLGTIWKDTGMGAALLLSVGLLLFARERSSKAAFFAALLALLYGFSLRHNAAPAVLPLALWAGSIAARLWPARRLRKGAHALVLGSLVFASIGSLALLIDHLLVNGNRLYPAQQILLHDIAAIAAKTGQLHVPSSMRSKGGDVSVENLACVYTPDSAVAVFNGKRDACTFRFDKLVDAGRMSDLRHAWLRAVSSNPYAYLEHRLGVFRAQFAMDGRRVCYPIQVGIVPNGLGITFHESPLYRPALEILTFAAYATPLFRGWVYLAVLGLLLSTVWFWGRRDLLPCLAVASSGLAYGLTYLGVSTTCDFRMHWWSVVAAVILVALALTRAGTRWARGCPPAMRA